MRMVDCTIITVRTKKNHKLKHAKKRLQSIQYLFVYLVTSKLHLYVFSVTVFFHIVYATEQTTYFTDLFPVRTQMYIAKSCLMTLN